MSKEEKSTSVQIAGTIGGLCVALVALNLIFAPHFAWTSIFIVLIMVVFGIVLVNYETKINKKK